MGGHFFKLVSLFLFVFATGLPGHAAFQCPDYGQSGSGPDDQRFQTLLKKSWDETMRENPEWGYQMGHPELGDDWSDDSLQAIQNRQKKAHCLKKALDSISKRQLSQKNKLNYELFREALLTRIQAQKFPYEYLAINQLGGVHTDVIDTLLEMPQNNRAEINHILKRLEKIPLKIEQNKILLSKGLELGITEPQVVLKKIPEQFDDILKKNPKDSVLFKPFKELKALPPQEQETVREQALQVIQGKVMPAMADFKKFLVTTYIPQARKTTSLEALPQGKEWYRWAIQKQTTTDMTADQIHELGLREVARITKEMEEIKVQTGFKKDLKAFNDYLMKDPKFYYQNPEDLLKGYRNIAKQMDAALPQYFKTLPRLTYGVRAIPAYKEKAAPTAYYTPGNPVIGRAGYFEANTYDLKTRPKWGMEALTYHEAVPGHHLQIALSQEQKDLPDFRKYGGYTAFSEGWGLYAESLAKDMGFYKDLYSRYGQLTYEMWRAVRLVVDTGLHAKGWSREKALKYFMDHLAKSQLESEVEIDRYIAWPGQALAYKVGQLKFLEIRQKAKKALGEHFDIREFHDALLRGGALPLTLLEKRMNQWIQAQKRKYSIE